MNGRLDGSLLVKASSEQSLHQGSHDRDVSRVAPAGPRWRKLNVQRRKLDSRIIDMGSVEVVVSHLAGIPEPSRVEPEAPV